jgi:hypothetical protein
MVSASSEMCISFKQDIARSMLDGSFNCYGWNVAGQDELACLGALDCLGKGAARYSRGLHGFGSAATLLDRKMQRQEGKSQLQQFVCSPLSTQAELAF